MDQEALVREQVDGGRKLLNRLTDSGLSLTAAFWAKTEDYAGWHLYLASPTVKGSGSLPVYEAAFRALDELAGQWSHPFEVIDPFTVKVIASSDPMAREVADIMGRYPVPTRDTWYRTNWVGDSAVSGLFIYALPRPAPTPAAGS